MLWAILYKEKKMDRNKYEIDRHKLFYHIHRVLDWFNHKNIYPIYVEISPSGGCNHRCIFCSEDFMSYKKQFIDTKILKERLEEMGRLGVKSVMYAGEGEPFLHKDMGDIIVYTKHSGIDVAITTNGVLMDQCVLDKILGVTQWIRVSCNAGTPENYANIHRTKACDFNKVFDNLRYAVDLKKKYAYNCTLGLQSLLLPENKDEIETLGYIAKEINLDYFIIKAYTRHFRNRHDYNIQYDQYRYMADKLKKLNTANFEVIFRIKAMQRWDSKKRDYGKCLALPFWSYIDAAGNVWGCSAHLKESRFRYGNIYQQTFQNIWEGEARIQSLHWVQTEFTMESCKLNCRMDEINQYLWRLKNPSEHDNFI